MSQATLLGICSDNVVTILHPSSTIECVNGAMDENAVEPGGCYSDYLYWDTTTNQWLPGGDTVHIGCDAGSIAQKSYAVAIGVSAGQTAQGGSSVALGHLAGQTNQGSYSVAIGPSAGNTGQQTQAISIGNSAGQMNQQPYAIAIGELAGQTGQNTNAIAIGQSSGKTNQGANSIAIGTLAGQTNQAANSIVLNASTAPPQPAPATAGFFVNPIRDITTDPPTTWKQLYWNTATGEIGFK